MAAQYWLLKTEPETYSLETLKKERKTPWNGIRNFQARNFLKQMKKGDIALIYHSGDDKAVVGIARVVNEYYPEEVKGEKPGTWVQVDVEYQGVFPKPVTLTEIKTEKSLQNLKLIKQSRLSTMPVDKKEFEILCKLGGVKL